MRVTELRNLVLVRGDQLDMDAAGPGAVPSRAAFAPDTITREQALRGHRQVHPAHEPALQWLPLQPSAKNGRDRLPIHDAVS